LLALIVAIILLLALYAWFTIPSTPQDRAAWVSQLKDLGQTFLLTPFVSLLSAVVGYIFGTTAHPPAANIQQDKN
jgi:uncharacterized membrane protein YfcA